MDTVRSTVHAAPLDSSKACCSSHRPGVFGPGDWTYDCSLLHLTCLAPIDSNIFSNRTLICWMLFISTHGWRKRQESSVEAKKVEIKQKIHQVQEIKVSVEEDERTQGKLQEVEVEKWAAVAD